VKKPLVWGVALTVAAGLGAWTYYAGHSTPEAPTIATAVVTRGEVIEVVDATGTLQAVTTVQVGTQVSGTIKALHADFNSRVRRGQVIAELEPSLFETQVEQARASVQRLEAEVRRAEVQREDAQQKLRRARELAARELIATSDLDAAEMTARMADSAVNAAQAQVVQARASLHQSEVNLGHTIITAPIDGVVISRNVDVGQTVAASMQAPTLFVIARDLRDMQVEASIGEADIGRVRAGQPITFRVDAYPSEVFGGTVSQVRLQPVVEQNVVSYVTVIDVPNPDLRLKPGMTATVTVEVARATDVLAVPNPALRVRRAPEVVATTGERTGEAASHGEIWVLVEGTLERVPVRVGVSDGTRSAVFSPALAEGMKVVTAITGETPGPPAATTSPLLPSFRGRGASGSRRSGAPPASR
jgi:HlyD family secretion protein